MATIRILAIDGGGIRGIIPAKVLVAIEERCKTRIAQLFDLIAGTSTGGILAAGLCIPAADGTTPRYAATALLDMYKLHGGAIFRAGWLRKLVSLFVGAEYSPAELEKQLASYLEDATLKDAVTGLLITAYDMRAGAAWFFSRAQARSRPNDRNFLLREVARATSAAPTYFPPARLTGVGREEPVLVDGGLFANNPALCAWVDEHEGVNAQSDVLLVSLGTGSVPHPVTFSRARRWGKIRWAQPALGAVLDGQSDAAQYQLAQLLDADHYLRLQVDLPVENEKLDNASPANIAALEAAADRMLADPDNARRLADMCKRLQRS